MATPDTSDSASRRMSGAKLTLGLVLVAVAASAVAIGVVRESSKARAGEATLTPNVQRDVVTVYYFHGAARCETCLAIESATERAVQAGFSSEIEHGMLRYIAVDFDAPQHRHFRAEYDLAFGSVVVQGIGETRPWKNLANVWSLVHGDPAEFDAYIAEHIDAMLAGNG